MLSSTYWSIVGGSDNTVLSPTTTKPIYAPTKPCVAGGGCGTVTAIFQTLKKGSATVTAVRTSCGEAMGCAGDQGSFSVKILVTD